MLTDVGGRSMAALWLDTLVPDLLEGRPYPL
jgi:hypothetical protein